MLHGNSSVWLLLGFAGCTLLGGVLVALTWFGKLRIPRFVAPLILGLGVVQLLIFKQSMGSVDTDRRREVQRFNSATVTQVKLQSGNQVTALTNASDIAAVFAEVQAVKSMPAHHSHPIKMVDLAFRDQNTPYRYRVGQDSENSDEYWIFRVRDDGTEGREIGRVQSTQIGPLLEKLLRQSR